MKNNRKKYIINSKFQFSFIGLMSGISATIIIVFYSANLIFFKSFIDKGKSLGLNSDHVFFQFLSIQFQKMNLIFFITSVIAFLIIAIFGILISHRICGPIFKLCRHMNNIADGENPTEVKFRKNDYFKEIESSFNRIVNNIFNKK